MVQLKSDCAMMQFTLRIVDELHCHVLDESGLKGMVQLISVVYKGEVFHQDVNWYLIINDSNVVSFFCS